MVNLCPICQKDDAVQRVATLVAASQSSGTFSGPTGGVIYSNGKWGSVSGYSTMSGSTISNLALLLAPPSMPSQDTGIGEKIISVLLLFLALPLAGFCRIISGPSGSDSEIIILTVIFIVIAIFVAIAGAQKKKLSDEQRPALIAKWERAKAYWERLYFCHRDGIVFDPESNKFCQPLQIKEFVSSNTP